MRIIMQKNEQELPFANIGNRTGQDENTTNKQGLKNNGKNTSSYFAGNLNQPKDKILMKTQQAQKQALKVVGDVYDRHQKIDNSIEERYTHMEQLQAEAQNANAQIQEIDASKEALREKYNINPESQEQKDLDLLIKEQDSKRPNSSTTLTKEETEQLSKIDRESLTDYQSIALSYNSEKDALYNKMDKANSMIGNEGRSIDATKKELLKDNSMINASKQADAILEAARKERITLLMQEAKEHIEEEQAKKKEEALKKSEEKKEEEEKLEKSKEDSTEKAEDTAPEESLTDPNTPQSELDKELKKIVDQLKLLEEDLKGAAVDQKL